MDTSIIIPFETSTFGPAVQLASEVGSFGPVVLAGPPGGQGRAEGAQVVEAPGRAAGLRAALARVKTPITVVLEPDPALARTPMQELVAPIVQDSADAVFGTVARPALGQRTLGAMTRWVTGAAIANPYSSARAFRTAPLQQLDLKSTGPEIDAEIVVKLAARLYRLREIPLTLPALTTQGAAAGLARARLLFRYATVQNDADNLHEGYNTLARMEEAPRYNAFLAERFRPHLGRRVLEVGAGIGTITERIAAGREVTALEMDPFYVERLKNRFRHQSNIRPLLSGVERADWERLAKDGYDTVLLSNVLEHIEDDAAAVRNFATVLAGGGTLVVLVPALPQLYGAIDRAVGHFRRYTRAGLRQTLEQNGFVVERTEWLNLAGIAGWFVNGRILKREAVPPLQLRAYDWVAPWLARAESMVHLPVGMSLLAVARATGA